MFYKELLEAYPEAKVIVTTRDSVDQWHHSMMNTLMPFFEGFVRPPATLWTRLLQYFMPVDSADFVLCQLLLEHFSMYRDLGYDMENGTEKGKEWYRAHIKELEKIVPKEKLLVMNIKEGWEPICRFLGDEVPKYPFPKKNDMVVFQKNAADLGMVMQRVALWEMAKTLGAAMLGLLAVGVGLAKTKKWL